MEKLSIETGWLKERFEEAAALELPEWRSEFARDRDRIVHSEGLRKLQDKSQIFGTVWMPQLFSRVTHSIQVSQIGRSIAARLSYEADSMKELLSPELIEAICLAHDIGHPPFGHEGESALQESMSTFGGFEGNAQTFRLLTKLEERRRGQTGLNLTRAVLLGVLKYPWTVAEALEIDPNLKKFCFYSGSDYKTEDLDWLSELYPNVPRDRRLNKDKPPRTLACEIMDFADTIAYAVHDLEDAFQANFLRSDTISGEEFASCMRAPYEVRWKKAIGKSPSQSDTSKCTFDAMLSEFRNLFAKVHPYPAKYTDSKSLREVASGLINRFIVDLKVVDTDLEFPFNKGLEFNSMDNWAFLTFLLCVTQECVVRDVRVNSFAFRSRMVVSELFNALKENIEQGKKETNSFSKYLLFRRRHRETLMRIDSGHSGDENMKMRLVADVISCMSEAQALDAYNRLFSPSSPNPYSPIV